MHKIYKQELKIVVFYACMKIKFIYNLDCEDIVKGINLTESC